MINPWFKFYGSEYLSDTKIDSLTGNERSCWLTLLCLASQDKEGVIRFLTEEQLLRRSGVSEKLPIFKTFSDLGMIEVGNGNVTIKNWLKRQYSESINRVREYRKRNGNGDVTTEKNRIEENREDNILAKDISEIIKAFEEVDSKNKTYYGNKTQRSSCEFLLAEYGKEKILERIKVLPKTNKMPFFPRINSPNELKEKWVKLEDAVESKRSEIISKKNYVL